MANEILSKIHELHRRHGAALKLVFEYAKLLEPSLRDAGLNHQADRLQALLSAVDCVDSEIEQLIQENPVGVVEALLLDRVSAR